MAIKRGFSLIELVVVIGLLSLLMLAISSTMLMSIISSNRIRTLSTVKNAGTYALSRIQNMLRNSKDIVSCDSANSSITLTNPDGDNTTLATEVVGSYTAIASNSGTYLTPSNTNVTSFTLTCEPSDAEPTFVKVSYDLKDNLSTRKSVESPTLHFETSINLRNE